MPTEIWSSRLRSGRAGAGSWSLAVPTEICSSRWGCGATDILSSKLTRRRQCPWGPAVPTDIIEPELAAIPHWDLELAAEPFTDIWHSRLRSNWDLELAVIARECWIRFGARGKDPAVPTDILTSQLTCRNPDWDLEFAVEARQCPLTSGARNWGPAVPTKICSSQLRSGSGSGAPRLKTAVSTEIWSPRFRCGSAIRSRYPHLAGGEQQQIESANPQTEQKGFENNPLWPAQAK